MTFEERMAELGVDLSDITPVIDRIYCGDELRDAINGYYVDIIDCMEMRIVNLTGDVDYLKEIYEKLAEEYGYSEEYDGVPEDWSVDDEQS